MSKHTIYYFKKRKRYHLDDIYNLLGLLTPGVDYEQDDPSNKEGDSGESITFLKNITLKIEKVSK